MATMKGNVLTIAVQIPLATSPSLEIFRNNDKEFYTSEILNTFIYYLFFDYKIRKIKKTGFTCLYLRFLIYINQNNPQI